MGITIKDIAKIAGVSYSTVSKALNDSPLVKKDTKKKIVKIADELGYEPNFAAQRLVSKQTKIIGLIWPTIERVVLSTLVTKINNKINKTPYSMILSVESTETALDTFRKFQVDGIILFEENSKPSIRQTTIPLISYGVAKERDVEYPIIDANHEQAMYQAVKHLYELGHRDIAYIGDLSSTDPMQAEKYNGFMKAMEQYMLSIEDINMIDTGGLDWYNGYAATKKRFENPTYPTAIVGGSYDISSGIIRGIKEIGLDIPRDVSIISYDNIPQMANTEIPLTCIGVPVERLAEEIVQSIIHCIEEKNITSNVKKMSPILVERASCEKRK
ncbi:LacI family DNA-binding transcriptional regulator [Sporosarcina ureilytica]|uniref:Transcriptional regulator n=1 Tax=Sporosarcina ureilytica TaxID=298596 RepID=A0A1D8JIU3_9BACL|nr:LacI family DNA-binding transcriptional regulator [Sporosarcina ureilytica]AOV08611.1 transcriptional regulator [Sporosarcina ureilytica]